MTNKNYIFNQSEFEKEKDRLQQIEFIFDPETKKYLEESEIKTGNKCLEVGPGAGSILKWMLDKVGATGQVTAVDLNPRFIRDLQYDHLNLIEGDILEVDLEEEQFDIIHVRYVLVHTKNPRAVISKLVKLLKVDGSLIIEEPDFGGAMCLFGDQNQEESFGKIKKAIFKLFETKGCNPRLGIELPNHLAQEMPQSLRFENHSPISQGGSDLARMMAMSTKQLQELYLDTGEVSQVDIQNYTSFASDPRSYAIYYSTIAVIFKK